MLHWPDSGMWSAIDPPRALRSSLPEMERLEVRALLSVTVSQNFPDINFNQTSCGCTPPDTMMAVGPSTVVGAVNTALVLKDKSGNTLAGPEEFSTFFSSIHRSGDGFSDPYVVYDDQAGRYYVGLIEYPSSGTTGYYDFAASNSNSPTGLTVGTGAGQWTVFSQISSVNEGGTQFPDFPKMGWNNDAVFVSFNEFAGGVSFSHNLVLAISKSSILAGGSLSTHQTDVNTGSDINILIPARMHNEASGNLEYFAQATGGGASSTTVNVVTETGYNSGAGTFTTTPITVNAYTNSPGVPGLTSQIDDRMLSADWVNNNLVASMDAGVGGLNLARWYEFSTSGTPALVQQGDINVGSGVSTSYPSVGIDPNGDMGMTYIQSSSSQPYSMYVTGRLASDPVNTMQTGVEIAAGVSPVPSALRGGDYSATEYDPANTSQFWSANEYNFDNTGSNFDWGTQIASYTLGTPPPPADLAVTESGPSTGTEGANLTYTLTVTNKNSSYPNDAPGVVLTDTLGTNLKFVSATTSQGTFTQSGGVVTFSLGTVAYSPTQTITATVTAQATEDGSLANNASVSYSNDPVPGNNSASATTAVAEPTISVSGPITVTGKRVSNIVTATFTHASGVEPPSAFNATIHWGDGTTSAGSITLSGTTYTVRGSHNYSGRGSHTVTTTVTESGSVPNVAAPTVVTIQSSDAAGALTDSLNTSSVTPAAAPSRAPGGTAPLGPLALYTPFNQPGPSGPASAPNRTGIDPGIAILDMYANSPEDQVPGLLGIGLPPAARGKPRSIWGR
jgi:uncharacterized repeat protein (TIGR01451 family)